MLRLEVNVSDKIAEIIDDLTAAKHISATELVRLALSAYKAIQDIQDDPGRGLFVERDGKLNEVVFP
jgi:hypothetical protein